MPGGFQLGNSIAALQGLILGPVFLWLLATFIVWLLGLQIVAFVLDRTKRWLLIRWLLRITLLVKAMPLVFYSGLLVLGSLLSDDKGERASGDWWPIFVMSVVWFTFVPCALIALSSIVWMLRQALQKMIERSRTKVATSATAKSHAADA
jgi:hypothetical protein